MRDPTADRMAACNGEIRIMPARYGWTWLVIVTMVEQDERFWEYWDDLVCGDNDYFDARTFFEATTDDVLFLETHDPLSTIAEKTGHFIGNWGQP